MLQSVAARPIYSSLRSFDDIAARLGCSAEQVSQAVDQLIESAALVQQEVEMAEQLTGRRPALIRVTLAGQRLLERS